MRALQHERYGDPRKVLRLTEIPEPPAPGPGHVIMEPEAWSLNAADWHMVRGEPTFARLELGLRAPKARVPGCDLAGTVTATGDGVTHLSPGTRVLGTVFNAGFGAFAQRVTVPVDRLVPLPDGVDAPSAAASPLAGSTARQALERAGGVRPGMRVLVLGGTGGVGSFVVQLARQAGAEVTASASTANLDLLRGLGVQAIDHTTTDPLAGGPEFDLLIQCGGTATARQCLTRVAKDGAAVLLSGDSPNTFFGPLGRLVGAKLLAPRVPQRLVTFTVAPTRDDLEFLAARLADGSLVPVVGREVAFEEIPDALADLYRGGSAGKIVVRR
ncbi:MAG: NAD(P)-dependent alcohol dehydrogenase [bacterium]|nr:NAD(P)-dependent alcohol dehydrogenase [bacterium]